MPLRRSRLVAWIAAFAVLLQALWPVLSHARPKNQPLLASICTVDGVTHLLEIKTGKAPLDERAAKHGEHCKLCVFGDAKDAAVFSGDFDSFLLKSISSEDPASPKASFHPATLSPAHPRAPPAAS